MVLVGKPPYFMKTKAKKPSRTLNKVYLVLSKNDVERMLEKYEGKQGHNCLIWRAEVLALKSESGHHQLTDLRVF